MQISIITNDPELTAVCEKALEGLSPSTVELRRLDPTERPGGEVCIWEFDPDFFPERLTPEYVQPSLFVVDPGHLGRFRECLGVLRASIVLKPVLGPTLLPFLEHSFRACQGPQQTATQREDDSSERRKAELFELFITLQAGNAVSEFPSDKTNG
jgi:hypothetical protein